MSVFGQHMCNGCDLLFEAETLFNKPKKRIKLVNNMNRFIDLGMLAAMLNSEDISQKKKNETVEEQLKIRENEVKMLKRYLKNNK